MRTAVLLALIGKVAAGIGVDNVDETVQIIEVDTQYLTDDPSAFAGKIGVNTDMLTEDNGITRWIGVNTEYITQITSTVTDAKGSPVTQIQDVQASIIGNVPANGILTADLSIIITPSFQAEIDQITADFCPLPKLPKRGEKRALLCGPNFIKKVTAAFDIYAAAEVGTVVGGAGGIALVGGMFAAQMMKIAEGGGKIPLKMDINKDDFNKAKPVQTLVTIITVTRKPSATKKSSISSSMSGSRDPGKPPGSGPTLNPECWLYRGSEPDLTNVETDDNNNGPDLPDSSIPSKMKRVAGRVLYDTINTKLGLDASLQSRNPAAIFKRYPELAKLGNCPQPLTPPIKTATKYPSVAEAQKKSSGGLPKEQWWYIPQPASTPNLCKVYSLQHVGAPAPGLLPPGYDQQSNAAKKVSIDHACKSFTALFCLNPHILI